MKLINIPLMSSLLGVNARKGGGMFKWIKKLFKKKEYKPTEDDLIRLAQFRKLYNPECQDLEADLFHEECGDR